VVPGNFLRRRGSLRRTLPTLNLSNPVPGKAVLMEPNQQAEADAELVTETLVEEVSIDGMCGVY
jgi:mycofactocin precursor